MQNSYFWIRITSHNGTQVSPVDLWMQNGVLRSRMTLVYWTHPSSVVLCIQNSDLIAELLVSMGPALICGFCMQNSDFRNRNTSLHGSQTSPVVLYMQNNEFYIRITSLYGSKTSPVVLCTRNSVISIRNNRLYGSQTSPVALCMQNSVISTRITSLHGSQTSPIVLCMQNNMISIRITSL